MNISTVGEEVRAFVPHPLPPEPAMAYGASDHDLTTKASQALARLDELTAMLPDSALLIYAYIRKEAVVSAQIEGTQSSYENLMLHESDQAPGVPFDDVREVSDYIAALDHGLARLRGGFPLSLRLLREIHSVLMRSGRGSKQAPGEFRRSQVWIGGTRPGNARFVPPPPDRVLDCMGALEKFLHDDPVTTPSLLKASQAHVQFETIHPFLDGNGRMGRLLITLLLCTEQLITEPVLVPSLYFKQNREEYYQRLQRVRTSGDWEGWHRFFLRGIIETADGGLNTTKRVLKMFTDDRRRIEGLARASGSALRVYEYLQKRPIATIAQLRNTLGLTHPTVSAALGRMEAMGLVRELTGYGRNRVYAYQPLIDLIGEGTEPIG